MALPVSLNSRIWSGKGVKPAAGDEIYSAGEQPVAPYDNWAMWSITRDLYNITDELGAHADHHEVGGRDEIDLHNLQVNGVAAFNGDPTNNEFRFIDPDTGGSFARFDVDNDLIRQFPDFGVQARLAQGARLAADVVRDNAASTALYDHDAGSEGKFHHAKYADNAGHADYADVAGALEDDSGNQYEPGDFLTSDEDATITGNWSHANVLDADISGNAATADHADTADSAASADYATEAGNADKVDGHHAQDLIDQFASESQWQFIDEKVHANDGEYFEWMVQSPDVYDRYKLVIYHECHKDSGPKGYFWLQFGKGGTVDQRHRYHWRERDVANDRWTTHLDNDGMTVAGATRNESSLSELNISCPRPIDKPTYRYPHVGADVDEATVSVPRFFSYGKLETGFDTIDTFRLVSNTNRSTGKIKLYGRNI